MLDSWILFLLALLVLPQQKQNSQILAFRCFPLKDGNQRVFLLAPDAKERIEPFLKWEVLSPCVPARLPAGKNKQGHCLLCAENSQSKVIGDPSWCPEPLLKSGSTSVKENQGSELSLKSVAHLVGSKPVILKPVSLASSVKPGFHWNLVFIICFHLLVTNDTSVINCVPRKESRQMSNSGNFGIKTNHFITVFLFPTK